jgi:hypothetical protein
MKAQYDVFSYAMTLISGPWAVTSGLLTNVESGVSGGIILKSADAQLAVGVHREDVGDLTPTLFADSGVVYQYNFTLDRAFQAAGVGNSGVLVVYFPSTLPSADGTSYAMRVTLGATTVDGMVELGLCTLNNPLATFVAGVGTWAPGSIGAPFTFFACQLQLIIAIRPTAIVDVHESRAVLYAGDAFVNDGNLLTPIDTGWVPAPASSWPNNVAAATTRFHLEPSFAAPAGTVNMIRLLQAVIYEGGLTRPLVEPVIRQLLGYPTSSATAVLFPTSIRFTDSNLTAGVATFADGSLQAFLNASAALTNQTHTFDMSRMNGPFSWARPMPGAPVFYADFDLS